MSLRQRILLSIPVLFLALGLGTGFLAYRAVINEVRWGLEEEASSLAVGVAEFIAAIPMDVESLASTLDRLIGFEQARAVSVVQRDGSLRLQTVDPDWAQWIDTEAWEPPAIIREAMDQGSARVHLEPLISVAAEDGVQLAPSTLLRVWGTNEKGDAVLVTIDASRLDASATSVFWRFGLAALGFTLLGTLGAGLTANYLAREMDALGSAASRLTEGDKGLQLRPAGVYEIREMANTLNTLGSLLQDTLSRGRTLLLRQSSNHDPQAAARHYRNSRWEAHRAALPPAEVAGVRIVIQRLGTGEAGDFWGWVARESSAPAPAGVVWAGRLAGEPTLSLALLAEGIQKALLERLVAEDPLEVFAELRLHFSLESLDAAWWSSDDPSQIERVGWTADGAHGSDASIVQSTDRLPVLLRTVTGKEAALVDGWFAHEEKKAVPARPEALNTLGLNRLASGILIHLSLGPAVAPK